MFGPGFDLYALVYWPVIAIIRILPFHTYIYIDAPFRELLFLLCGLLQEAYEYDDDGTSRLLTIEKLEASLATVKSLHRAVGMF
jgi:hypothetical protein